MASRGCVCFVGNLPGDVREREIEDLFYKVSARCKHYHDDSVFEVQVTRDKGICMDLAASITYTFRASRLHASCGASPA